MVYNKKKWCWNMARVLYFALLLLFMGGCDDENDNIGLKMEQTTDMHSDSPYFYNTLNAGDENYFMLVNSQEELLAICKDGVNPPAIDFNKYTLVIGRCFHTDGYRVDLSHTVVGRSAKVYIQLRRVADAALAWMLYYHFWALRPKIVCDSAQFIIGVDK